MFSGAESYMLFPPGTVYSCPVCSRQKASDKTVIASLNFITGLEIAAP